MLEIGSFFGKCSFQGFSGTNGDSLIFPKLWGQGNRYLNWEKLGNLQGGDSPIFWGISGTNSPKNLKFRGGDGDSIDGEFGLTNQHPKTLFLFPKHV